MDAAGSNLTQGHLRQLGNGDLVNGYSDADNMGLLIGGGENIFPENFRVLSHGVAVIDLSALAPVALHHRTW